MGAEGLLFGFYDQPQLVQDIMDHLTAFWIRIYERMAKHVKIGCTHMWEDMAGKQGSLISPVMVERFMVSNYRRIKEFTQSYSIPLMSADSDGDVSELVPIMMAAGVNLFFPFEVQAGCDIEVYRKLCPGLGIMGDLDKQSLARDLADIDQQLEKAERMLQAGGYVAGLDHMLPPDVPKRNYSYYIQGLRQIILQGRRPS